jgi:hypothetical protein
MFEKQFSYEYDVIQIDGVQQNSHPTPGAFLNFSDTNYWKSSQLCKFLEFHNNHETSTNDHFLFTDAWNPIIIQLKYMKELLGLNWKFHGMWHAGSYDPADFLGRLIGNTLWVRNAEQSMFHAYDHNYFATNFHIDMFCEVFGPDHAEMLWKDIQVKKRKIVQTGWPMEYMPDTLSRYSNIPKQDVIVFPHRIAPEKQVEIFRDLEKALPQYKFIVCQDQQLSKNEYHTILGTAKMVFSANLQETLGISPFEGALLNAIPLVPNRLSYTEMYDEIFKYPSHWTENYTSYLTHKSELIQVIIDYMENYESLLDQLSNQSKLLSSKFFTASNLYRKF